MSVNNTNKKLSMNDVNNQLAEAMSTINNLQGEIADLIAENKELSSARDTTAAELEKRMSIQLELDQCKSDMEDLRASYDYLNTKSEISDKVYNEMVIEAQEGIKNAKAAVKRHRNISIGIVVTVAVVSIAIAIFK